MKHLSRRSLGALTLGALASTGLVACSKTEEGAGSGGAENGSALEVFASTSVWGSIAKDVGGDMVTVSSAVNNPDQDPHDYEATAEDKLKISRSTLAVINGGGYDTWATTLLNSVRTRPVVVDAFTTSGFKDGDNEHIFYSLDAARKTADALAAELSKIDSGNASKYSQNARALNAKLDDLEERAKNWGAKNPSEGVVSTESVAQYLLRDLGLKDLTPPEYITQSESEAGPSVATVEKTRQLIGKQATVLIVNGQTQDAVSTKLVEQATKTNVRIVKVYETFPEGVDDYVDFMTTAVDAITGA